MMADQTRLSETLDSISDPLSGGGLVTSRRAAAPRLSGNKASVILDVTGLDADTRQRLEGEVRERLLALDGVDEVRVALTAEKLERRIIAVGSGKGGVGKSTLTANLAVALHRLGVKVGLVDADIYGPSLPRLMSAEGKRPVAIEKQLQPVETEFGVPMLSMGQLVEPGRALAWRGPMAGSALGQLVDADWGAVELLLLDLPPGTGDVQLSMIQKHRPAGAVIVSTPQDLALMDATRAIDLFRQAAVPVVGIVENMAGYVCPHCGESSDPFGTGGAQASAEALDIPFLGRIPLDIGIRLASDAGRPPAAADGESPFEPVARALMDWLNKRNA